MNTLRSGKAKMTSSLSVPLLRPSGDSYILDRQVIDELFSSRSLIDTEVVIISMWGAMHCGKSLNLNYFYQYLQGNRDSQSPRSSNPPKRCFDWANGIKTQRKTIGIHVTRKPIFVRRSGQNLAVFLLDCEGTDMKSGNAQMFLFALSTLLSSVQIINVEKDIQDRDVYPLRPFITAFDELRNSVRKEIFETQLLFLVRDVTNTTSHRLGDADASQFFAKAFRTGFKRSIYDKLLKSFSGVDCFTMPHPGHMATVRRLKNEFSGSFKELNESFVHYLQNLMERILIPENLIIKRVNGKPITCGQFRDYIEACYDALHGTKDLGRGLLKLASHTRYQPLVEECGQIFKQSLTQDIRGTALNEAEFSEICDEKIQEVMRKFAEAAAGGIRGDQKEKYETLLEQDLHEIKNEISDDNRNFYKLCVEKNERAVRRGLKTYEMEFQNTISRQQVDRATVMEYHKTSMDHAIALFNRTPKQGGELFIQGFREDLHVRIQETYNNKVDEISFVDVESHSMAQTCVIGVRGGRFDHEVCSIGFQNGALSLDTEFTIKLCKDAVGWPDNEYLRRSPVIIFEPTNQRIRKPITCKLPIWYITYSRDVTTDENVYVMQKRGEAWSMIHHEAIVNKRSITCNISELSPIALATFVKEKKRQVTTILYLNTGGTFIAKFFDMDSPNVMSAIKESAKSGRYFTVVDMNTLEICPHDEISVSLRQHNSTPVADFQQFRGEDVYAPGITKSIQFVSPTVPTNENATKMIYEVRINNRSKISNPFKVNLNNPGRPDTAPTGPFNFSRTSAVGEYISITAE